MDQLYLVSVASTISGIMGKMLCYPLDTVKAQLYVSVLCQLSRWREVE